MCIMAARRAKYELKGTGRGRPSNEEFMIAIDSNGNLLHLLGRSPGAPSGIGFRPPLADKALTTYP